MNHDDATSAFASAELLACTRSHCEDDDCRCGNASYLYGVCRQLCDRRGNIQGFKALTIFGICVVCTARLWGSAVAGYLAEWYSWRYVFPRIDRHAQAVAGSMGILHGRLLAQSAGNAFADTFFYQTMIGVFALILVTFFARGRTLAAGFRWIMHMTR